MKIHATIRTRQGAGIIANLHARNARLKARIQEITSRRGHQLYELAYFRCPRDTGFSAEALALEISPGGLTFRVGWHERDFIVAGRAFAPLYFVFGTVNAPAQDPLFVSHEEVRPLYRADLRDALREFAH